MMGADARQGDVCTFAAPLEILSSRQHRSFVTLCLDMAPPKPQHMLLYMLSEETLRPSYLESLHHHVYVNIVPGCQHSLSHGPS